MRLPRFEYVEPKSVQEASSILLDEPKARILAGGTDLLVNMKHRVETPSLVVNIKRVPNLDFIYEKNGAIRIGALTSLKRIYTNPLVAEKLPGLSSAASSVGSYHHQTAGTIGGNICQENRCKYFNQSQWWRSSRPLCFKAGGETCYVMNKKEICYASYCGDMAPALLVLDGRVVLESSEGSREISLESLFSGNGKTPLNLGKGEILTEIIIPQKALDGFSIYLKSANRGSIDFPIVGMGLWASMERKEVSVSLTGVDRRPVRARSMEDFVVQKDLSEEKLREAVDHALREVKPVKTSIYPPSYKKRIAERLLRSAWEETFRRGMR